MVCQAIVQFKCKTWIFVTLKEFIELIDSLV